MTTRAHRHPSRTREIPTRYPLCPAVTPDGKYMSFIGGGDIWWVKADFLEAYRTPGLAVEGHERVCAGSTDSFTSSARPGAAGCPSP